MELSDRLTEPSPVVRDGVAYFAATNGNVYAIDLDGVNHAGSTPPARRSRPARRSPATGSTSATAGRVTLSRRGHGRSDLERDRRQQGVRDRGRRRRHVFAPDVGSGFTALSAQTGEVLWRVGTGTYTYASPAVYRNRVFFADYSGTVYAADTATGSIAWSASAGGAVSGALVVVDGVVYAGSFGGHITGWSWKTGREVSRSPTANTFRFRATADVLLHGFSRIYAVEPVRKAS